MEKYARSISQELEGTALDMEDRRELLVISFCPDLGLSDVFKNSWGEVPSIRYAI
jgi:hypothetical protein